MSLQPVNPHAPLAGPDALAFCNLSRPQGVSLIPLDADKTVLQFDAAEGQAESQATRCLVTHGKNGVSIRTIQGRMSVNNQVCKDAWLKLNDEISCGNTRLRLIQKPHDPGDPSKQPGSGPMTDGVYHITAETAPQAGAGKFFGPFPWEKENGGDLVDNSTMCLPPEQIQNLLAPSVYGIDDSAPQAFDGAKFENRRLRRATPTAEAPNFVACDATNQGEANCLGPARSADAASEPCWTFDCQIVVVDWHTSVCTDHLPELSNREMVRGVIIH
jgi:hypothetical protein